MARTIRKVMGMETSKDAASPWTKAVANMSPETRAQRLAELRASGSLAASPKLIAELEKYERQGKAKDRRGRLHRALDRVLDAGREWWPHGRHTYKPNDPDDGFCKACDLPKDHKLHTTPPPEDQAMKTKDARRLSPEDIARNERMEASKREAQEALRTNRCPMCGNGVYQNLALTGWVQCHGYPTASHRRPGHENDKPCHWQGFTHDSADAQRHRRLHDALDRAMDRKRARDAGYSNADLKDALARAEKANKENPSAENGAKVRAAKLALQAAQPAKDAGASEEAKARKKVNAALAAMPNYHPWIPNGTIDKILTANGFNEMEQGIYTGRDGRIHEKVGNNTWLSMTWHKMDSGRYEIVAYVS